MGFSSSSGFFGNQRSNQVVAALVAANAMGMVDIAGRTPIQLGTDGRHKGGHYCRSA